MYAVIFTAKVKSLNENYSRTAQMMREKAISEYGCTNFRSSMEGGNEIAVSYWPDLESIQAWKQDKDHLIAQQSGRKAWYASYQVDVVKIERSYSFNLD